MTGKQARPLTSSAGNAVAKPAAASGLIKCTLASLDCSDAALVEFNASHAARLTIAQRIVQQIAEDYCRTTGIKDDLFTCMYNDSKSGGLTIAVDNPVVAKYLLTIGLRHSYDTDLQSKYDFASAPALLQRDVQRSCLLHVEIFSTTNMFMMDYCFII